MIHPPHLMVRSRADMLNDPTIGSDFFDRIPRWKNETDHLCAIARQKNDKELIRASKYFYQTILPYKKPLLFQHHAHHPAITGRPIGNGGTVRVMSHKTRFSTFKKGEILVAIDTNPVFLPLIKKTKAIITDHGGVTSHAATLAREFKIPAVIGTKVATKVLKTGDRVEVDTKTGIVKKL